MSINLLPPFMWTDGTSDRIPEQVFVPGTPNFLPQAGTNTRTIVGADGNSYVVADATVNPRGAKNIVWSSEGYTGVNFKTPVAPLTAAQKKASGNQATNAGSGVILDTSAYSNLLLMINVSAFTGGTSPSIQFEYDVLDDTATPVSFALWKPAALSVAGALFVGIGAGMAFAQGASAPSTAATGFGAIAAPSGWTYYSIALPVAPNGQFAWTVTGSPTAITWTAWIYGLH
jgi:hypothetical protein